MPFSEKQIEEFRNIYFKQYGKELSITDAEEQAGKLLRLILLIYKPMALEEYEAIQRKRLDEMPEIIRHIALHDPDSSV